MLCHHELPFIMSYHSSGSGCLGCVNILIFMLFFGSQIAEKQFKHGFLNIIFRKRKSSHTKRGIKFQDVRLCWLLEMHLFMIWQTFVQEALFVIYVVYADSLALIHSTEAFLNGWMVCLIYTCYLMYFVFQTKKIAVKLKEFEKIWKLEIHRQLRRILWCMQEMIIEYK